MEPDPVTPGELSEWLDRAGRAFADFVYEYDTEDRLVRVGLKEEPAFEPILERHGWLLAPETLTLLRRCRAELGAADAERARRLYFYALESHVADACADAVERLEGELAEASIDLDGDAASYFDAADRIAVEDDFDRRESIAASRDAVDERVNALRERVLECEAAAVRAHGYESVVALQNDRRGIDHRELLARIAELRSQLQPLYDEALSALKRARLPDRPGPLGTEHGGYVFRLDDFASDFRADSLLPVARATLAGLGVDLDALRNVHLDLEDRPGKAIGPACYPSRVPDEIHLVVRGLAGEPGYRLFFHEAGHALHYALTDPTLPLELRQFGTSAALTETFAFAIQGLVREPEWQRRNLRLAPDTSARLVRRQAVADLHFLLWHAARLDYELVLFASPGDPDRNADRYARTFGDHTGFVYRPASYLRHVDGSLSSADYLRALLTEAMLREALTEAFGPSWFRSRDAGALLEGLWRRGDSVECEDLARELGFEPWDGAPVRRLYERLLST